MSRKSIKFEDKEINKSSFYKNKKPFRAEDIDISKILVTLKKEQYGKNPNSFICFIRYNDDDVIRPLYIKLPQMVGYVKHFNDGKTIKKTMSFNAIDKKLLKNYTKIWRKISSLLNKEFDSDPVYGDNDKYIKTKIR